MDRSSLNKFHLGGGGGDFSAKSQLRGSMMHEILVCEVTSCAMTQAEYLTKRQRGGFFGQFSRLKLLPVEYSSVSF